MKKKLIIIVITVSLLSSILFILFNIRLVGESSINISYTEKFDDPGYKSIIKAKVKNNYKNKIGKYEIIYSNFLSKKIRTVNVIDDVAPVITLEGDNVIELNLGNPYIEPGYKAIDEIDGDITEKVEIIDGIDISKVGSYKISYNIKDKSGNKTKIIRTVNIIDNLYKDAYDNESNELEGWYTGNKKDGERPREKEITYFKNKNAYFLGKDEKKIYLTFDEGGTETYLEDILEILDKNNIKATFFLCKNFVANNKELVKKMSNNGHSIGNHTVKHLSMPSLATKHNFDAFYNEIKETEMTIREATGKAPEKLFRYPMGEYSDRTLQIMKTLGYKTYFWSVAYKDWDDTCSYTFALNNMKTQLHNGAIYLIHPKAKCNYEAFEEFIEYAKDEGYKFGLVKNI